MVLKSVVQRRDCPGSERSRRHPPRTLLRESALYGVLYLLRGVCAADGTGFVHGVQLFVFWHRSVLLARARKMIEPDVLRYEVPLSPTCITSSSIALLVLSPALVPTVP